MWLKNFLWRHFVRSAPHYYSKIRRLQNNAARLAFLQQVGSVQENCQVSHPLYLYGAQYITVGNNFRAEPGLRLEAIDKYMGDTYHPNIIIGNGVDINFGAHIGAIDRVEIGNNVLIGSHVLITDHSHGSTSGEDMFLMPIMRPLVSKGPVIIENNVWIGEGACILAGVRIGQNAIIGANAVVTRDVPAGSVVGGIPAKVIGTRQ